MPRSFVLILPLLLLACGDHHGDHDDHATHATSNLNTNDGARWQMDTHTRSMFATMVDRVAEFDGDDHELGRALQGDLNKLVEGCTMTGDAHNELHKFLGMYMPAVHELSESGAATGRGRVEELLALYPQYFE